MNPETEVKYEVVGGPSDGAFYLVDESRHESDDAFEIRLYGNVHVYRVSTSDRRLRYVGVKEKL